MKCLYCRTLVRRETHYAASRKGYHLLGCAGLDSEQCGEPLFDETTVDAIQDILRSVEPRLTRLPVLTPA